MIKQLALIVGLVLVAVGVLGFVPGATSDGMLLGVFHTNTAYNLIHLVTGAVAVWAGLQSTKVARMCFQGFGVLYGLIAIAGFMTPEGQDIFGVIANNTASNWLHVAIAATSLALGFVVKDEETPTTVRT